MLILPFIHKINKNNNIFEVNTIKFLTVGGQLIWEEKSSFDIDSDILNPNDIYRKNKPIKYDKSLQMCEIDNIKTNILEFYKWEEIDLDNTETFCWKTYYYLNGGNNQCWLEIPDSEKLGKYKVKDLIKAIIQKK
jgi:hypothetical protein